MWNTAGCTSGRRGDRGEESGRLINPKSWVKLTYETTDDLDALMVTAFIKPNV
jgi:hypothetical protein